MAQIIDQIVKISIEDGVSAVGTTDVNTMALVGKASDGKSGTAGEYRTASGVGEADGTDSELYAMAVKMFAQDSQPSSVVCIPADSFADSLAAAKKAAETLQFYHVCAATGDELPTAERLEAWQDFLADAKKILHVQVPPSTGNASETALMASLKAYGADRVAVYLHTEGLSASSGEASGEYLNVGIVAMRCASDSARGTFAHRKCSGVKADGYTGDAFASLVGCGLNIYVNVAGESRLFMGTTCDSEHFVDQVAKDDWIRFNVQSRLFSLLGDANDGHGVNYDNAGIASVAATVLNVLNVAQDADHQYVMSDSATVEYKDYDYLKANRPDDVRKRNLPLVTGRYARMNAVHTVVQVGLQVTL